MRTIRATTTKILDAFEFRGEILTADEIAQRTDEPYNHIAQVLAFLTGDQLGCPQKILIERCEVQGQAYEYTRKDWT